MIIDAHGGDPDQGEEPSWGLCPFKIKDDEVVLSETGGRFYSKMASMAEVKLFDNMAVRDSFEYLTEIDQGDGSS